jgi:2-hydroxychromene-2-carboxylate isomerase
MTLTVDLFWSFRSPYSYLATPRVVALAEKFDMEVNVRPVYPIALRKAKFFQQVDPNWVSYLITDTVRIAERERIPFGFPRPDPVVMDMASGDVPDHQPYINRLMRLGVLASEQGKGLPFIYEVSRIIWSGEVDGWDTGNNLEHAVSRAGLNLQEMEAEIARDPERLDLIARANEHAQQDAGHWGVPLFVFEGEPFFGQDRIDALIQRMNERGLRRRY